MGKVVKQSNALLIFNPNAGAKRKKLGAGNGITIEDIKKYLVQYQIPVDLAPTEHPGHATEIAREAVKKGYTMVLAAGGDGTVGETANGLIDTSVTLGIIPMGTFMNVCKMLAVPNDVEKAIMLIKMGRTRKIDVGTIVKLSGKKMTSNRYFLESAGVGLDARLYDLNERYQKGDIRALYKLIKLIFTFYRSKITLTFDDVKKKEVLSPIISIANGPVASAAVTFAPDAKLNDHVLTVAIFKLQGWKLLWYLWQTTRGKTDATKREVEYIQAKTVEIHANHPISVHADAREFGHTPAKFEVNASSLQVICGYPSPDDTVMLLPRTSLDLT